jgi:hypothetical protein
MSQPPKTTSSSCASGTNSLIFGERFSVRLPRRIVAHLRERSNRLRETFANGNDAGDGGGADRAEPDQEDSERSLCRGDF